MAYDMSPAEIQAYLDQAQSPAERLAALQAMGAPMAAAPPAPVAPAPMAGSGGTGGASPVPAVGAATPADQTYAEQYAQMSGRPVASLGGAPQSAPAAPQVIPEVTVTPGAPRALGGLQAPAKPPVNLRAAMAEAVGAPPPGQPELRNPVGDFVKPFTPDELAAQREIEGEQFANVNDQAEAQQYAAEATRRASMAALDKQDAIDAENNRRQMERQRTLEEGEQRFREMADQMASEPIDSERLWNNKSTGEKVLGSIAVFLGAIGQGVAGLPNMAWEKIQRDIDRDIEAQKANKALLKDRLAAEGSLIDMTRARFADAATQDEAMKAAAYRRVIAELDRFAEFAKTPERKAQLDAVRLQAESAYAAKEQAWRQALDTAVLQQREADRRRAAAAAGPTPMQMLQQEAKAQGLRASIAKSKREITGEPDPKEAAEARKLEVPGMGRAYSEGSAKEARAIIQSNKALEANINDLERLTNEGGADISSKIPGFTSDKAKDASSLRDTAVIPKLALALAGNFNPSVEHDKKAKELAYGLTSPIASTRKAAFKAVRKYIKSGNQSAGVAHVEGYKPPDEGL